MQIESTMALISINATLVVQLVSFLIFLFIINRIMLKPLEGVQAARAERMEEMRQEMIRAENEVERMLAVLAEEEDKAKEEAFKRQQEMDEDARRQVNRIFEEVKAEIDTLKRQTRQKVDAQIEDIKHHLPEEAQKMAQVIMEKVLERRLADETV